MSEISFYLKEKREAKGLSKKALAEEIGISQQYLSDIERGFRTPQHYYLLAAFAKTLELNSDYLCYLVGILPQDLVGAERPEVTPDKVIQVFHELRKSLRG